MTQTLGQCPKCGPLLNLKAGPGRWLLSHFMGEESDTQSYPGPSRKFMSELGFEPRTPNSSDVCLPLSSAVTQTQKAPRGGFVSEQKKRDESIVTLLPFLCLTQWRAGRHPPSTCAGAGRAKDTAGGEGRARGGAPSHPPQVSPGGTLLPTAVEKGLSCRLGFLS